MDVYKIHAGKLRACYGLEAELNPLYGRAVSLMRSIKERIPPPREFSAERSDYVDRMVRLQTLLFGMLIARDDFDKRPYRVLDLGCGAKNNDDEALSPLAPSRYYEPWLARTLPVLGHAVIGIDAQAGVLEENFPHIHGDFLEPETYGSIPAGSIDMVTANYVFCSPSLEQARPGATFAELYEQVLPHVRRVLRPDGAFVINNGAHDGKAFQLLEGTHWLADFKLVAR